MTGAKLLEKLLYSFEGSYDIERNCDVGGYIYDAYASFNATSSKYVLIKKAELWRADCFEHVLFSVEDRFTEAHIEGLRKAIEEYVEPFLVRGGKRWPEKNHMYTYMTAIYICENQVEGAVKKAIRSFRYVKNYKFSIRGYSEARILVFDMKKGEIFGNSAAKELVKGYKKSGIF